VTVKIVQCLRNSCRDSIKWAKSRKSAPMDLSAAPVFHSEGVRRHGSAWMHRALLTMLVSLLFAMPLPAQTVTYIHADGLGSIVAESDAEGNVTRRENYEPYGQGLGEHASNGPAYTGHVSDAATGLSYMQQRYYDPLVGRFLSADPVTAYSNPVTAFSRYRYANNNPYLFRDPDGRDAKDVWGGFIDGMARNFLATPSLIQAQPVDLSPQPYGGVKVNAGNGDYATGERVANVLTTAIEVAAGGLAGAGRVTAAKAATTAEAGAASTLKPGPYAGESIAARSSAQRFTAEERASINQIGRRTGCHSCGTTTPGTKSGNFVPDHQPVSSLNKADAGQRLYPQCIDCSRKQGLEAARELRKEQK